MDGFCLLRLANFVPYFALYNGVMVSLRDVCYYKVVALKSVGFLPVHIPAVAGGARVGVGRAVELEAVPLLHQPGPGGAADLHTGGVPHVQQDGHRPDIKPIIRHSHHWVSSPHRRDLSAMLEAEHVKVLL